MNKIIECNSLSYSYFDGKQETPILNNLNLSVKQGESIAILGQSGCGKSTLLNLLGGIDKPTQGEVLINGNNLGLLNENDTTLLRGKYLGFVYQFHHLLNDFSALDNVAMPERIQGKNQQFAQTNAEKILSKIGLEHRLNHLPSELSGGERQRVAIARALITNPSCILADEPTGNLDAENAHEVLNLMLTLNRAQNCSLIVVTHDEKIAAKMDKALVLNHGVLIPLT
ncbi:lipoprotein-releasing ABC transporter ATP-binding protein [Isorropodon fossajaponicum endosymbiont JTNG4]|uniref:lipoprotein-releasing ABC transporter ATP-binding protein LolD n=1 Tax=Isorropodon fossajaponicum symbiont TaxID=883811 RepID=UPI0019164124|nr:lipoprotein-releasing ABC transporter ATP-binding protein LolD [Isorropodon fossajaponicum symbiont]BBB23799.1 lipoprotein-releasing ABC transporter ATP-binding protein [Isorropodon fossajaponicum endosymbiont JTNG4]